WLPGRGAVKRDFYEHLNVRRFRATSGTIGQKPRQYKILWRGFRVQKLGLWRDNPRFGRWTFISAIHGVFALKKFSVRKCKRGLTTTICCDTMPSVSETKKLNSVPELLPSMKFMPQPKSTGFTRGRRLRPTTAAQWFQGFYSSVPLAPR